ncbi:MAG: MarR family winged helix-turn-helix transcriptional regulator [Spirochaetales bacterium]|uniref:MarR family winged helix-turn-helix transcriptional regulator n=1 Tax=Candidatus Thalassospirochaeta sargassi TaxID=3119039 RepID=A0AAJ1IL70_9SPIO|nr:MarR family winged helix-turn-helix transcriptional regulator [Spirochaetales bacterium]
MHIYTSPGHYISAIYRHLQIYLNREFASLGFGSGQYLFFNHISHHEGITQKELSRRLSIDKATTAKAVHKLTEKGYIEQRQSKTDKRFNNLYLTEQGRTILPEVREILKQTIEILQRGMTDSEGETALKLMHVMLGNITDETTRVRSKDE